MPERLSSSSGNSFATEPSTWDSIALGAPVEVLHKLAIGNLETFDSEAKQAIGQLSAEGVRLVTTRIASERLVEIDKLQELGFHFVEMTISPSLTHFVPEGEGSYFEVHYATSFEIERIAGVAFEGFNVSRYHNDPKVSNEMANLRFRNWVYNAVSSTDQRVLAVVDEADELMAFFIYSQDGNNSYWHLTAIAKNFRGKGLARKIWRSVMNFQMNQGVTAFETTISAGNLPVLNLYPKLGFVLGKPQVSLHLHI